MVKKRIMKKKIIVAFTILFICSIFSKAQITNNHSISYTTLFGMEYSYEHAVEGNFSLIGRAGLVLAGPDMDDTSDGIHYQWYLEPGFTVEPRWYVNIARRQEKGKSLYKNSANFVALRTSVYPYLQKFTISLLPVYGIRRVTQGNWMHEFTAGLQVNGGGANSIAPHICYRIGYSF